jgi:hypothetical protein
MANPKANVEKNARDLCEALGKMHTVRELIDAARLAADSLKEPKARALAALLGVIAKRHAAAYNQADVIADRLVIATVKKPGAPSLKLVG